MMTSNIPLLVHVLLFYEILSVLIKCPFWHAVIINGQSKLFPSIYRTRTYASEF